MKFSVFFCFIYLFIFWASFFRLLSKKSGHCCQNCVPNLWWKNVFEKTTFILIFSEFWPCSFVRLVKVAFYVTAWKVYGNFFFKKHFNFQKFSRFRCKKFQVFLWVFLCGNVKTALYVSRGICWADIYLEKLIELNVLSDFKRKLIWQVKQRGCQNNILHFQKKIFCENYSF